MYAWPVWVGLVIAHVLNEITPETMICQRPASRTGLLHG